MQTAPIRPAAALALALCAALAAPARAQQDVIEHRVVPGDTLEALSVHYLATPRLWPRLQAINHVADPRRLMPGTVLRIPASLLPAAQASAVFVSGQAQVLLPGAGQARPLQPGDDLPEGARLQVANDGFVSVRLVDGTIIRVKADADLQLQQLRRQGRAGSARSVLQLGRGSVESTVAPSEGGARHFEIRTPAASTSVRGTRFGVALTGAGQTLATVTEGEVAVQAAAPAPTLLPAGQGMQVQADGRSGAPRPLLAAPDLSALPATVGDADFVRLPLPAQAGAVAWQVELARDADFTQIVRSATVQGPQALLASVDDGSYHLAVRAVDAEQLPGLPAQRRLTVKAHPLPPLYQSPAPQAVLERGTGQLVCTPVVGSVRYRIQVAAGADFAAPLLDQVSDGDCQASVSALAPGRYQWRAASIRSAQGQDDQGPFTPPQAFTLAERPAAPDLQALALDHQDAQTQLHWSGQSGQHYRLQLAAAADFAAILADDTLAEPRWTAPQLPLGRYYVRLQVSDDASGLVSDFSTPRQLRLGTGLQTGDGQPVNASDGSPWAR